MSINAFIVACFPPAARLWNSVIWPSRDSHVHPIFVAVCTTALEQFPLNIINSLFNAAYFIIWVFLDRILHTFLQTSFQLKATKTINRGIIACIFCKVNTMAHFIRQCKELLILFYIVRLSTYLKLIIHIILLSTIVPGESKKKKNARRLKISCSLNIKAMMLKTVFSHS